MEAGRGAYCNPIHAHAYCVHAHQGRGLSERSCSLPQTRRRVEGKERVLPGEREREQGRASERRHAQLWEDSGEAPRFFLPTSFTHADRAARRSCVVFCA